MADPDPSISNGTCMYARRKFASDNFIPCGNSAFGDHHCCQVGDVCLDDNACYNGKWGTTYLAGCTDAEYEHPSCPDKKSYSDYPWAGLIYCKPNRWMACKETGKPTAIKSGDPCTCPTDSETMTVAFSAPWQITAIGILPSTSGGTIEWQPGHFPTEGLTTSFPSSSAVPSDTVSSWVTSTTTSAPSTSVSLSDGGVNGSAQGHSLSDGVKAGIGIGSAVGGILLFGALSALWVVFRRRRNDKGAPTDPAGTGSEQAPGSGRNEKPTEPDQGQGPAEMPTPVVPSGPAYSELPISPWGAPPELQGNMTPTKSGPGSPLGSHPVRLYGYSSGQVASHAVPPVPAVAEETGHQGQGQGRIPSMAETLRPSPSTATELPA